LVCSDEGSTDSNLLCIGIREKVKRVKQQVRIRTTQPPKHHSSINNGSSRLLPSKAHVGRPSDCSYGAGDESNLKDVKPRRAVFVPHKRTEGTRRNTRSIIIKLPIIKT
jgi:hypothetical protein